MVMSKKGNEVFKNSAKCLICDKDYVDNGVKVEVLQIEIVLSTFNKTTKFLSSFNT